MISLILGIVLGAVSVVFVLQNTMPVAVSFFEWQVNGSLALILLLAIICGIVMTLLVLLPGVIRGDFHLSSLKRRQKELENDLENARRELSDAKVRLAAAQTAGASPTSVSA